MASPGQRLRMLKINRSKKYSDVTVHGAKANLFILPSVKGKGKVIIARFSNGIIGAVNKIPGRKQAPKKTVSQ